MLSSNHLGAPAHRALSLLPLPRLRELSLNRNVFDGAGLAALASAPWLTQLTQLDLTEQCYPSKQICESILSAIEDDAWVFGRLRRLGCSVNVDPTESDGYDFGGGCDFRGDALELGSGDGLGSDVGSDG